MRRKLYSLLALSISVLSAACSSGGEGGADVPAVDGGHAGGAVATAGAEANSGGSTAGRDAAGGSSAAGAAGGASNSGGGGNGSVAGASAGGASGQTGAGGAGGSATNGGATANGGAPSCGNVTGTSTRPQLTATEAANDTILEYLAQSDNWNPTAGLGSASAFTPDFTVAADGSGTHKTLQAAITAAGTGSARRYILIKPGSYREQVKYMGATPLTIYGADSDATHVVIVDNLSAATAGGTSKTATFMSSAPGLQLMNLTVSNDFATPSSGSDLQAVALYVTGDKTVLENVRLHGFQDTLFTDTASDSKASRVYIRNSFIEGDTDFIFGGASLVIDSSTLNYLSSRKGSGSGIYLAPSTRVSNDFGFLVIASNFTADASAPSNKISLGRSWDEGGVSPTPNGQAVIRESVLGAHINKTAPWAAAATSGRAYSATGNRFSEFCNSGKGAGP
ncbi:MAG: pectinesterase family protein [Pseudomonadota bacterium]